jgi:hypothetical protein
LIAAAESGVASASPRVRFATVATWWLERFEAKVAAGERHPRTLESHRYHVEHHLLPVFATKRLSALTVDDVAALLSELNAKGCSAKTAAGRARHASQHRPLRAPASVDRSRSGRPARG